MSNLTRRIIRKGELVRVRSIPFDAAVYQVKRVFIDAKGAWRVILTAWPTPSVEWNFSLRNVERIGRPAA